ncbi:hypothetical protein OA77_03495, partial [Pseudomonas coronafaciens]
MNTKVRFTSLALALMLGSSAALADIKVGVAMSQFDDTWLTYLREDMGAKAKNHARRRDAAICRCPCGRQQAARSGQ